MGDAGMFGTSESLGTQTEDSLTFRGIWIGGL